MKHLMLFEDYTVYQKKLIDDLLDKGFKNLTPEEKNIFNNIDKQKEPPKEPYKDPVHSDIEFDFDESKVNVFTDSTGQIKVRVLNKIELETNVQYSCQLLYDGVVYEGSIIVDRETENQEYELTDDKGVNFEPSEYDLQYEFDDLILQILYDENINQ